MAMELKQHLKLSQQLVMTPQLQQAIKLLQLSRMELLEQVREELEQNPLLEQPDETGDGEMAEKAPGEASLEAETQEPPPQATPPGPDRAQEVKVDGEGPPEIDWEAYLNSYQFTEPTTPSNRGNVASEDLPSFEANLVKKEDLFEHLAYQLGMLKLNDAGRGRRSSDCAGLGGGCADGGRRAHPAQDSAPRPQGLRRARPSGVPADPGLRAARFERPAARHDYQAAHEALGVQKSPRHRQGPQGLARRGGRRGQAFGEARSQARPQLLRRRRAVHHPGRLRLQAGRRVHGGPQRRRLVEASNLRNLPKCAA